MFIVKVGEVPYVGTELGFWETRENAIKCAERYIKNSTTGVTWVKRGNEDSWSSGCNWIQIYGITLEMDLF